MRIKANGNGAAFAHFEDKNGGYFDFGKNSSGSSDAYFYTPNNIPLNFYTSGTIRLTVRGDGNVGIGATNPQNTLEVTSPSSGLSGLRLTNLTSSSATSTGNGKVLSVDTNGDVILVDDKVDSGTNYLVQRTSSNQTFTNTTFTSVTDLDFPIAANEKWVVTYKLDINSPKAADVKFRVNAPSGATCTVAEGDIEGATSVGNLGCGASTGSVPGNGATDLYIVTATIINGGTSGTVSLKTAQNTASGTTTLYSGSYMTAFKVTGADLAEVYYANDYSIKAGDIIALDNIGAGQIRKTNQEYDQGSIGIVSTKPGLVLSDLDGAGMPVTVGLSGRVPVNVSTKNGDIKPGDYITASDIPGIGMKATGAGKVVGQALTALAGDNIEGQIIVFIQNTYFDGYYDNSSSTDMLNASSSTSTITTVTQDGNRTVLANGSIADRFTHLVRLAIEKLSDIFLNIKLWIQNLKADKVETKELCIDDLCINKEQLQNLLNNQNQNNFNNSNNSNNSTNNSNTGNTTNTENTNTDSTENGTTTDNGTDNSTSTSTGDTDNSSTTEDNNGTSTPIISPESTTTPETTTEPSTTTEPGSTPDTTTTPETTPTPTPDTTSTPEPDNIESPETTPTPTPAPETTPTP